ncbi:hypothetical protein RZS08_32750, partial [Arthrospira platensis SPKY1]|nr:hypothetical protein [Arthrospira platensis SPKY1]
YPLTRKVCEVHSLLPHDEALAWQTRSHINLLLTWSDDSIEGILTGKLFEYIGAGNPILAIVNGKKDTELENLFSQFSCGTVLYSTSANVHTQIQKFILEKFELWQSGQYSDSYT